MVSVESRNPRIAYLGVSTSRYLARLQSVCRAVVSSESSGGGMPVSGIEFLMDY